MEDAPVTSKKTFWFGLAAGLGVTAVIGLIIYLARRRGPLDGAFGAFAGASPTYILNQAPGGVVVGGAGMAGAMAPVPTLQASSLKGPPIRGTVSYPKNPSIGRTTTVSTEASALYYADRDVKLTVGCVGPAGGFAFVGIDSDLSDDTSGIFIPAGDWRPINIRAGQRLYGRGSVDQTMISISG